MGLDPLKSTVTLCTEVTTGPVKMATMRTPAAIPSILRLGALTISADSAAMPTPRMAVGSQLGHSVVPVRTSHDVTKATRATAPPAILVSKEFRFKMRMSRVIPTVRASGVASAAV